MQAVTITKREKRNRNVMLENVAQGIVNKWMSDENRSTFVCEITPQIAGHVRKPRFQGILQAKINEVDDRFTADIVLTDLQIRFKFKTDYNP